MTANVPERSVFSSCHDSETMYLQRHEIDFVAELATREFIRSCTVVFAKRDVLRFRGVSSHKIADTGGLKNNEGMYMDLLPEREWIKPSEVTQFYGISRYTLSKMIKDSREKGFEIKVAKVLMHRGRMTRRHRPLILIFKESLDLYLMAHVSPGERISGRG